MSGEFVVRRMQISEFVKELVSGTTKPKIIPSSGWNLWMAGKVPLNSSWFAKELQANDFQLSIKTLNEYLSLVKAELTAEGKLVETDNQQWVRKVS